MYSWKIKSETDQEENSTASEKASQKPAGNSIKLKKKNQVTRMQTGWQLTYTEYKKSWL